MSITTAATSTANEAGMYRQYYYNNSRHHEMAMYHPQNGDYDTLS